MKVYIILLVLTLSASSVLAQSKTQVVVLYSDPEELLYIQNALPTSGIELTTVKLQGKLTMEFDSYDALIFASSLEFTLSSSTEQSMKNLLLRENTRSIFITPYLEDFEDTMEDALGIIGKEELFDPSNITSWRTKLKESFSGYNVGDEFNYIGPVGVYNFSNPDVLAEVIETNSTEFNISHPFPILVNVTTTKSIVSTGSLLQSSPEDILQLDAFPFPDFISSLIGQLLNFQISAATHASNVGSNQTSGTDATGPSEGNGGNINFPQVNVVYPLGALIIALIALLFRRIVDFIRWLSEKFMYFGVGIVGAYFNIQDRNLNQGDVLLNAYRSQILDVLDLLGKSGAHLRELKTTTGLGSGSLLWHLQTLEDFGMIYKFSVKRYTVFVASEFVDDFSYELKRLELELQSKHSQALLTELVEFNSTDIITPDDLILDLDISRKTAQRFFKKLEREALVQRVENGYTILNQKMIRELESNLSNRNDILTGRIVLE